MYDIILTYRQWSGYVQSCTKSWAHVLFSAELKVLSCWEELKRLSNTKRKTCAAPMSLSHKKYHWCLPVKAEMWTVNTCNRLLSLLPTCSQANLSLLQNLSFATKSVRVWQPKEPVVIRMLLLNPRVWFCVFLQVFLFKMAMCNWERKNKIYHE